MKFTTGDQSDLALTYVVAETAAQKVLPGAVVEMTRSALSEGMLVVVTPPVLEGAAFTIPADPGAASVASAATSAARLACHTMLDAAGEVVAELRAASERRGREAGYSDGSKDARLDAEISSINLLRAQVNDLYAEAEEAREDSLTLHAIRKILFDPSDVDYSFRVLAAKDVLEGRTAPSDVFAVRHPAGKALA